MEEHDNYYASEAFASEFHEILKMNVFNISTTFGNNVPLINNTTLCKLAYVT